VKINLVEGEITNIKITSLPTYSWLKRFSTEGVESRQSSCCVKETAKNILKSIGVYHPLQGFYRSLLKQFTKVRYRNQYKRYKGDGYTCIIASFLFKICAWYPAAENRGAIETTR